MSTAASSIWYATMYGVPTTTSSRVPDTLPGRAIAG